MSQMPKLISEYLDRIAENIDLHMDIKILRREMLARIQGTLLVAMHDEYKRGLEDGQNQIKQQAFDGLLKGITEGMTGS